MQYKGDVTGDTEMKAAAAAVANVVRRKTKIRIIIWKALSLPIKIKGYTRQILFAPI